MSDIKRIFVRKHKSFDVESSSVSRELNSAFKASNIKLTIFNIYDIYDHSSDELEEVINVILSSKNTDAIEDIVFNKEQMFAVEYLPGQYDQRADRAMQCAAISNPKTKVKIKSGKLYVFNNKVSSEEMQKVKKYVINPIESREKDLSVLTNTLEVSIKPLKNIDNFISMSDKEIEGLFNTLHLAMTLDDFKHIHKYFKDEEKRDPSETEVRMLDTYWSDHCRHTTFETEIEKVEFSDEKINDEIKKDWDLYKKIKENVSSHKPTTLMDIATSLPKYLIKNGKMDDVEISSEINACTIIRDIDVDGKNIPYSIQFKNETHNHPTEIEPFGGASTCLGGAIRDPLSGRAYVYQGLRITGAGDITEGVDKTIEGKLPQRKISKTAAQGFSSYGNEIGMSTAFIKEIFHNGYKAKRMEVGAVVGANEASMIKREEPNEGDLVIMIGGRTGRDGIGGATGSSKKHDSSSIDTASSEVQKGNAPEERKIQRLFRNPDLTTLIKKSNDFGAGGLSVAVGEIADSLEIFIDRLPLKYQGLNSHEVTLSESQERMAIVIDKKDKEKVFKLAHAENLEASHIATVTNSGRLVIKDKENVIVNVSRDFLNTNGVRQRASAIIKGNKVSSRTVDGKTITDKFLNNLSDLNVASQKGLIEMFDFSIGNSTVLAPFGGAKQNSPTQVSVQKIPVKDSFTNSSTMMTYGYNPYISNNSPYLGGMYAVVESIAKLVSAGSDIDGIRFSFQEYFERLNKDDEKWGKPLAALLGAYRVQHHFESAAIGGKDSMSGTYENISVPPTLISFALSVVDANNVISTDFKKEDNNLYLFKARKDSNGILDLEQIKKGYQVIANLIKSKDIVSAFALEHGGIAEAIAKMSFGTNLGFEINSEEDLFDFNIGSIVFESSKKLEGFDVIGKVSKHVYKVNGEEISHETSLDKWETVFDEVYPREVEGKKEKVGDLKSEIKEHSYKPKKTTENPKVLIPVFPGTNCEYDMQRKFAREGAICEQFVFKNLTSSDIVESTKIMAEKIRESDILVLPGGFSASDEPDGSGKFIASILKSKDVKDSIEKHLEDRKLIIGICNGFQALVRSGLLPYGEIKDTDSGDPILFKNNINRHVAKYVTTKVMNNTSPWLKGFEIGENHQIPISHGEGRLVANQELLEMMIKENMIAFQYVDEDGNVANGGKFNPNGSTFGIEGLVSKDGLILGKMGHSERYEDNICKNIYGNKDQNVFKNAIKYFRGA